MPITLDSLIVRTDGLMSTPLDQDVVILNPARDNYIGLDELGRKLWDLLASPRNVGELCREMAKDFPGDPRQIEADVVFFLNELTAEGLVDVAKK